MNIASPSRRFLLGLVLFCASCGGSVSVAQDGESSDNSATTSEATDPGGDDSSSSAEQSKSQLDDDAGSAALEIEVEEYVPTKEEVAQAAVDLEVRKSFDQIVFGCGLDLDYERCVDLRELTTPEVVEELVTRCEIKDLVACQALESTVIADLQVQCLYQDEQASCETLVSPWSRTADDNYGLADTMTSATLEDLKSACESGGVVECVELLDRSGS